MTSKAMTAANQQLSLLHQQFEQKRHILEDLTGGDVQRIKRVTMSALIRAADDEKVRQCSPVSIFRAVAQAVILDLDLTMGEAWLVPFKGQCTLLPGYRGLQKHAAKVGFMIVAEPVFEKEHFVFTRVPLRLEHTPKLDEAERGRRIGAYAAAFRGGELVNATWVTNADIEKARKMSTSPAWGSWPDRMVRKLPISRLAKELHGIPRKLIEVDSAFDKGGTVDVDLDTPKELKPVVTDKLAAGRHFGFAQEPEAGGAASNPLDDLPMFDAQTGEVSDNNQEGE